jgi:hypothetical protein
MADQGGGSIGAGLLRLPASSVKSITIIDDRHSRISLCVMMPQA